MVYGKKAGLLQQSLTHIILIGALFALFFLATTAKANSRAVTQQILEKQLALVIDSGEPGMDFYITKVNMRGYVNEIKVSNKRVYAYVSDYKISDGYPFFTKYKVSVEETKEGFFVRIR